MHRAYVSLVPLAAAAGLALAASRPAAAQHGHDPDASPYREMLEREIKALADEEVAGLLEGEGLGFALAAELNGHPGPKHTLELAESIGLTPTQRERVQAIRDAMQLEALRLGARLVEAERELDRVFAAGTIDRTRLRERVHDAARLRGELRVVHLEAHLAVTEVLEPAQVERYLRLRGYRGAEGDPGGH